MTFGGQCDESTSRSIMDHAVEQGVTFFDSSDIYPLADEMEKKVGITEEWIGRWLSGRRDEVILATKCFGATGPHPWQRGASRKHIMEALEGSLRRLGTDYIDLYQLHNYDDNTPI